MGVVKLTIVVVAWVIVQAEQMDAERQAEVAACATGLGAMADEHRVRRGRANFGAVPTRRAPRIPLESTGPPWTNRGRVPLAATRWSPGGPRHTLRLAARDAAVGGHARVPFAGPPSDETGLPRSDCLGSDGAGVAVAAVCG